MWKVNLISILLVVTARADEISDIEKLFKSNHQAQGKVAIAKYLSQTDSATAYEKIGALYARFKNWPEAVHYFEIAKNRKPNSAILNYKLGIAYHQNKELEKAVEVLRAAIRLDPKFLKAIFALADILEAASDHYEARLIYQQALRINSGNGELRSKLCVFAFKGAFWRQANQDCTKAVSKNPKDTTAWALAAVSAFELQQRDKAFLEFKKAMALNKDSAILHKARGLLYYRENSFEQAAQDLGRAAALDSYDEETILFLARALYEMERYRDARVAYKEAVRLEPSIKFEFQSKQRELLKKAKRSLSEEYQDSINQI